MCSKSVTRQRKNSFMSICSMRVVNNLGNYLGISLVHGKVTKAVFNPIMEKIQKCIASWKANLLNKAGRLCLAKSVISFIPIYTMQTMWLPQRDVNKRSLNLFRWDVLTRQKCDGGLGIRDARIANISLLGKLCWNLVSNNEKLWCRVLKSKYLGDNSVLFPPRKASSSYTWRSVVKANHHLRDGFSLHLGSRAKSFWYDNWSGFGKLCNFVNFVNISDTQLLWNFDILYTLVPPIIKDFIRDTYPLSNKNAEEGWIWESHDTGAYSANSGYWWLNYYDEVIDPVSEVWRWVWHIKVLEKVKFMCWLGIHDDIPSNELCFRRNMSLSPICTRCHSGNEELMHIFRDCRMLSAIWKRLGFNEPSLWVVCSFRLWVFGGVGGGEITPSLCRPFPGQVKLNVDGSCIRGTNVMGGGGVIRDHEGRWLSSFSANFGVGSPILVELLAMEHGLNLAWDLGFKEIILESDCLEAVQIIPDGVRICLDNILLHVSNVRTWLTRNWMVEVKFVVREANKVADFMVKLGSHSSTILKIWSSAP
ncbi:hypothetical protein Lal_00005830 [Lupinus albus]|nr:hypothetical protein Lal_00005830 [Lupinus albus]